MRPSYDSSAKSPPCLVTCTAAARDRHSPDLPRPGLVGRVIDCLTIWRPTCLSGGRRIIGQTVYGSGFHVQQIDLPAAFTPTRMEEDCLSVWRPAHAGAHWSTHGRHLFRISSHRHSRCKSPPRPCASMKMRFVGRRANNQGDVRAGWMEQSELHSIDPIQSMGVSKYSCLVHSWNTPDGPSYDTERETVLTKRQQFWWTGRRQPAWCKHDLSQVRKPEVTGRRKYQATIVRQPRNVPDKRKFRDHLSGRSRGLQVRCQWKNIAGQTAGLAKPSEGHMATIGGEYRTASRIYQLSCRRSIRPY